MGAFFGINIPISVDEAMKIVNLPSLQNSAKALTIKGWIQLYIPDYQNEKKGEQTLKKAVSLGSAFALGYLMTFYEENEEEPKVYEILLPFVNKGDKMASLYAFHMFKDTSFAEDVDTRKDKYC